LIALAIVAGTASRSPRTPITAKSEQRIVRGSQSVISGKIIHKGRPPNPIHYRPN